MLCYGRMAVEFFVLDLDPAFEEEKKPKPARKIAGHHIHIREWYVVYVVFSGLVGVGVGVVVAAVPLPRALCS